MQAVGISGALVTLIVLAARLAHFDITPVEAAALVAVIVSLAGYFKRNRA